MEPHTTVEKQGKIFIRPICEEDVELEREFIMRLSPTSRRFRFLDTMAAPSEQLLQRLTHIDKSRDAAFVALVGNEDSRHIVGVTRMCGLADGRAEMAVTVSDEWQQKGLGTVLVKQLIDEARRRGIVALFSIDASANRAMQQLAADLGFERKINPQDPTEVIYSLSLKNA